MDPSDIWRLHQSSQFPPSCLPLAIDGLKLVKLDAAAGALLTASLRADGVVRPLDEKKRGDLERQRLLIVRVLAEVPLDAEGRAYFQRLADLSQLVLGRP